MTCPSCGGVVGRDCFNPQECAEIGRQQEMNERRAEADRGIGMELRIARLEHQVEYLQNQVAGLMGREGPP